AEYGIRALIVTGVQTCALPISLAAENTKAEADARAYGISGTMKALGTADARILQALASTGMKPEQLIAFAFQELAAKAEKIGQRSEERRVGIETCTTYAHNETT